MEEDIVYKYTENVIKQIVKKDDEYTRKMIKEYVRTKYPNEKVRIDFYDEETIDKIIDLGINALNFKKTVHTCLHCGNNTPLYCEKCYQELISKNAELQNLLELNDFQDRKNYELKIEELQLKNDSIPKQKIRLELEKVTKEIKEVEKKHLKARTIHNQELWRCVLIRLDETIKVYEELLK